MSHISVSLICGPARLSRTRSRSLLRQAPGKKAQRPVLSARATRRHAALFAKGIETIPVFARLSIMQQQPGDDHAGGDLNKATGQGTVQKWTDDRPDIPARRHFGISEDVADQLPARNTPESPSRSIDDGAFVKHPETG